MWDRASGQKSKSVRNKTIVFFALALSALGEPRKHLGKFRKDQGSPGMPREAQGSPGVRRVASRLGGTVQMARKVKVYIIK